MDFARYLVARLGEASTYGGIAALLVAFHLMPSTDVWQATVQGATALAGVAAVLLRENSTG